VGLIVGFALSIGLGSGQDKQGRHQKSGTARLANPHRFTEKHGQYLASIYVYVHIFHPPPAEADRTGLPDRVPMRSRATAA